MTAHHAGRCARAALFLVVGVSTPHASETARWPNRPSMAAACAAWEYHIRDLLEQHRLAQEMDDDEFGRDLSQLYAALSYCTLGDYKQALMTFDSLRVRRLSSLPLR